MVRAANRPDPFTKPRKVVITRFSAIGDVAMTLPVVYSVCRANPDVEFIYVSRPSMTSMMINRPDNLTLHPADVSNDYKGVAGMRRLFDEIRRDHGGFDALADLHSVLRTTILVAYCRLAGIKVARLDKSRVHRRALTRSRNKRMLPLRPMVDRYADVFDRLGLRRGEPFKSLFDGGEAHPTLYAAIAGPKRPGERRVAVAPFAKHPGKIYPPEKMREVVEALVKTDTSLTIYLFGGGEYEKNILARWANALPRVRSLAGERHGFPAELALMSTMDAMVSMDSANMHLASLAGIPVVSVWGATHPYCGFRGYGQTDTDAVQLTMTCRPCSVFGNKPCRRGDLHCLTGIAPQAIVDKVKTLIYR